MADDGYDASRVFGDDAPDKDTALDVVVDDDAALDDELFAAFDCLKAPETAKEAAVKAMVAALADKPVAERDATTPSVPAEAAVSKTPSAASASSASRKQRSKDSGGNRRRKMTAFALAACLLFAGILGGVAYATPVAYVSLESVPAVELSVNYFDVTIQVTAQNEDGERLLSEVDVKYKPYDQSIDMLLNAAESAGLIDSASPITVTISSDRESQSASLEAKSQAVLDSHGLAGECTVTDKGTGDGASAAGGDTIDRPGDGSVGSGSGEDTGGLSDDVSSGSSGSGSGTSSQGDGSSGTPGSQNPQNNSTDGTGADGSGASVPSQQQPGDGTAPVDSGVGSNPSAP